MKARCSIQTSAVHRIAAHLMLAAFFAAMDSPLAAQGAVDPSLNLALTRSGKNVVVSWFATSAVQYQLESTSNLTMWATASPILTASNAFVSVTNAVGQGRAFFRVKRVVPGNPGSATFDASSGVLTVIGDDLDNTIAVGRNSGGTILVNNGATPITG